MGGGFGWGGLVESVVLQDTMPYRYPDSHKDKATVVPVFWHGGRDAALAHVAQRAIRTLLEDKCVVHGR